MLLARNAQLEGETMSLEKAKDHLAKFGKADAVMEFDTSSPTAAAASSTVALDVSNSITASALPNFARCSFAFSSDMISPFD